MTIRRARGPPIYDICIMRFREISTCTAVRPSVARQVTLQCRSRTHFLVGRNRKNWNSDDCRTVYSDRRIMYGLRRVKGFHRGADCLRDFGKLDCSADGGVAGDGKNRSHDDRFLFTPVRPSPVGCVSPNGRDIPPGEMDARSGRGRTMNEFRPVAIIITTRWRSLL